MTTDLSATLRRMASGEAVAEWEGVLTASAHLIDRLTTDLARRDGLSEVELMAHYRPGERATAAGTGPGLAQTPKTGASDTLPIRGPQQALSRKV